MRAVVQRVSSASVTVEGTRIARIKAGILVLIGFQESDDAKAFRFIQDKIINLRIFQDELGKMNLSVKDLDGDILLVPNFTLYGDCRQGRRPSYSNGARPEKAAAQFERFCDGVKSEFEKTQRGQFQADMKIELINDGPVTLLLDSDKNF